MKPFQYNGQDSVSYRGQQSFVTANQNARNAFVYGVSASLSADITRQFSIVSTVNYTYGRIKTDSVDYPLDHIAPMFGKTDFILKLKKFKGSFYVIYNGAKRSSDYNTIGEDNQLYSSDPVKGFIPAWMTLNLRASYQINKVLQVQGAVDNILDTYYRVFASGIGSPGRNFVLTLRANF